MNKRAAPLALLLLGAAALRAADDLPLSSLRLPPGFKVSVFARDVAGARSMTPGPDGVLFVGTRRAGKVYAVLYDAKTMTAGRVITLAKGLREPNGVAYKDGALYVAEIGRILRFDGIAGRLESPPKPVVLADALPEDGAHGWKFIAFGPDGFLYVPVGVPCNVCDEGDPYGTILRVDPRTGAWTVYARGIRNTVGFDWRPGADELWFTDNGRDWLGDDGPPDELNRAAKPGLHFGFPYVHGGTIPDPEFGGKGAGKTFTPPAQNLGPHVASLGMRFYEGKMFPAEYRGKVFIAEHGSWNRSTPLGYRVTTVDVDKDGRASRYAVFAEGWLAKDGAWGRPVDVQELKDGSLLVSDDEAGALYRISR